MIKTLRIMNERATGEQRVKGVRDLPLMELVGMMPSAVPPYPPDTMEVSLRLGPDTITCCRSCKWFGRTGITKEGRGLRWECRVDVYSLEGDKHYC